MIKKILFSAIFLCLCIAVPLSVMGFSHVDLGAPFLAFMKNVNNEVNGFKIAIPDIPSIPHIASEGFGGDNILDVLINLANGLITFVNVIIMLINLIADVINIVISLVQFLVVIIKNLVSFKDSLENTPLPVL